MECTFITRSLPKNVDKNIEHEVYHITRHHGFSAEQRIKNQIDQLLFEYKHGNDTHEHIKQQNQWAINLFLGCHKDYI